MANLMQASQQWATRPADQRFTSLPSMLDHFLAVRRNSRQLNVGSRQIHALPTGNTADSGLQIMGPNGGAADPTHWAFGQLANLAGAPAGYLRTLPAPIAADCINVGLAKRPVEDVGLLISRTADGSVDMRAATGPRYGRVWNADVVDALVNRFGDGITGEFRVPGEFGKAVDVTKQNTTLYASDEDMFVFLADETNRIEIPNRRDGQSGSLARGFFVWNSEVGSATLGVGLFLFDYACSNRIVWGAEGYREIKIRHTSGAPDRFVHEVAPTLLAYANASASPIETALKAAQAKRVDDVDALLANRFGARMVDKLKARHMVEEGRPIETLWDVATAGTALARDIPNTNDRLKFERLSSGVLDLVAA